MLRSRIWLAIAAIAALVGWQGTAWAQATCGITGSAATAQTVNYDPFNPTSIGTITIQLDLLRRNPTGGGKTDVVNFYLKGQSAASDNIQIVPTAVAVEGNVAGLNANIFYNYTATPPTVAPTSVSPTGTNRFLKISFTGNNAASDRAVVTFNVTLPPSLNLVATATLSFDAIFACSTTGGGPSTQQTGSITNAISFPIQVLSGLQASYVGSALDFGEVGDKTTLQVLAAPATYTTPTTNYVRVASSGPFSVMLEPNAAQQYRLTFPGSTLTNANHTLKYTVKFLGQIKSNVSPTFASVTCARAGTDAAAGILPITATLLEGGQAKTPAANYAETLTVTVTPLLSTAGSQQNCPAL